jgi:hypothetical protein
VELVVVMISYFPWQWINVVRFCRRSYWKWSADVNCASVKRAVNQD